MVDLNLFRSRSVFRAWIITCQSSCMVKLFWGLIIYTIIPLKIFPVWNYCRYMKFSLYPTIWTIYRFIVLWLLHSYDVLARFEESWHLISSMTSFNLQHRTSQSLIWQRIHTNKSQSCLFYRFIQFFGIRFSIWNILVSFCWGGGLSLSPLLTLHRY